jgi:hypothetical protein
MQVRHDLGQLRRRCSFSLSVVSMLALTIMYVVVSAIPAWAQQQIGAARVVANKVTGTLPSARESVALHAGIDVFHNEVIDTAANSSTVLVFQDNTQLSICPRSEVVLPTLISSGCLPLRLGTLPVSARRTRSPAPGGPP